MADVNREGDHGWYNKNNQSNSANSRYSQRPLSWNQPHPPPVGFCSPRGVNIPMSTSYNDPCVWERASSRADRDAGITAVSPLRPRYGQPIDSNEGHCDSGHYVLDDGDDETERLRGRVASPEDIDSTLSSPTSPKRPSHVVLPRTKTSPSKSKSSSGSRRGLSDSNLCAGGDSNANFPEPLLFCKLICKKPRATFCIALTVHLMVILASGFLYVIGYDILPTNFNSIPLNLREREVFLRQEAWLNRDRSPDLYFRAKAGRDVTKRSVKYETLNTYIIFEKKGGNIFTKENLQAIRSLEDEFYRDKDYQRKFCLLNNGQSCEKPLSVIRFFDGTYASLHPDFNDTEFSRIPEVIGRAYRNVYTKRVLQAFLGKNSNIDLDNGIAQSDITRLILYYGYPLEGFNTTRDDSKEQYEKLEEYLVEKWADRWKDISSSGYNGMNFMYMNLAVFWHEVNSQLFTDLLFIGGSFVFIFLFMWFQTRSLWLTCWGMMSTVFSFINGNFVYNVLVDFKYLGIFHVLSMFIILGIAADDVFIFVDTWKSLEKQPFPSIPHRLSACYRRSARTMFVTSFTTAAAFFINSFSPILAISSFGTFSGITVLMNYLSIILFFPTVLAMWHLNWETEPLCGSSCHCMDARPETYEGSRDIESMTDGTRTTARVEDRQTSVNHYVTRFLTGPYYRFLMNNFVRAGVLIFFGGLIGAFIYFSTTLRPDDRRPRVMKPTHHFEQFDDKTLHGFQPSDQDDNTKVYIVWGLNLQDRGPCHARKFADCVGSTKWDDSFDLNPPPAQEALLKFCNKLLTMSKEDADSFRIRRDVTTDEPEVKCFIKAMDDFFEEEEDALLKNGSRRYSKGLNLKLPTTELKMRQFVKANPKLYRKKNFHETFYRYFETAYAYWISNRHTGIPSYETEKYSLLIGEAVDGRDSAEIKGQKGVKFGTRLKYAAIAINLTITAGATYYRDGLDLYEKWETFVSDEIQEMPPSVRGAFQTTPLTWHWFHIQEALVEQGGISVVAGIAVAWLVLVISSGNIIVGSMATFAIAGITVCVIGCIPLAGWKLGVLEAMNMTLVVGLAIDYVVHLGMAYNHAPYPDRARRVQHALHEIGLPVLCGAITTMGSGLFMMFAQILFFTQFGIFIFATIGFSILFALTFYMVVLSLIGPQGDMGSTGPLIRAIWSWCTGRRKDDVECAVCKGKGFVRRNCLTHNVESISAAPGTAF